jgi:hypothetical protein
MSDMSRDPFRVGGKAGKSSSFPLGSNHRKTAREHSRAVRVPLRRLERRHLPPEGSALSTELQGRIKWIVTQAMGFFKQGGVG